MAEVILTIGNREHRIPCKDGTEDAFRRIATKIDSRWADAVRASGGKSDERSMLYVALMLADALDEAEQRSAIAAPAPIVTPPITADSPNLDKLAARLEAIAAALENPTQSA